LSYPRPGLRTPVARGLSCCQVLASLSPAEDLAQTVSRARQSEPSEPCRSVGLTRLRGQSIITVPVRRGLTAADSGSNANMIAQLRGTLTEKRPNQVIVDVGGVGYLVNISLLTFYAVGELHQEVSLLIHTHVREDSLALYGFLTAREKHLFELLLSVSGVGPALAIKILSGMTVDDLVPAIRQGDLLRLTRIPGVGRKTAERMVVELRDKLAAMEPPEAVPAPSRTGPAGDVISALLNLGYDRRSAEAAVESVERETPGAQEGKTFESLLRAALQQLSSPARKGARAPILSERAASGEA